MGGQALASSRIGVAVGVRFQVVGAEDVVRAAHQLMTDLFTDDRYLAEPVSAEPADLLVYGVSESAVVVDDRRFDIRSTAEAIETIQWHLNQVVVERCIRTMTGLHAAGAARDGRLVLLPAESGSGKSTTVAGLVRAGWQYLSDEACLIDSATLEVQPYPKPVGLERGSWRLFPDVSRLVEPHGTWLVPSGCLGTGGVCGPMVPAAVVSPRYEPGRKTALRRVSPGELVMDLAQSTFSFNMDGTRHLRVLARLAREIPGYVLTVSSLPEAVELLGAVAAAREA